MPDAVVRGRDGYLRVFYEKLGLKFETYDHWVASGARIPSADRDRGTRKSNIGEIVMTQIFSLLGKLTCWTAATVILASVSVANAQQSFKSPEDAVAALVSATKDNWPKGVVARARTRCRRDRLLRRQGCRRRHARKNFSRPMTPSIR